MPKYKFIVINRIGAEFESSPGHSAVVRRRPSPSILPANYLIIFNLSFEAVRTRSPLARPREWWSRDVARWL